MPRLKWALIYLVAFALSLGGGMMLASWHLARQGFAGIESVKWNDGVGISVTDLPYGPKPLNRFDLYLPADKSKSAYKLVLYIHAGGFRAGDKADDASFAQFFTSMGYVSAAINYSLRTDSNMVSVYDMTREIEQGVRAVVDAANKRGFRIDAMAIGGGSAGGLLAMVYAYRDSGNAPVPVRPVFNFVGPASFEPSQWFGIDYAKDDHARAAASFLTMMSGRDITVDDMRSGTYRDKVRDVTPCDLVTKNSPPTLAAFGALDKVAPYAASTCLAPALERLGVAHDVLVFPDSGHGLQRNADMNRALGVKLRRYLETYL